MIVKISKSNNYSQKNWTHAGNKTCSEHSDQIAPRTLFVEQPDSKRLQEATKPLLPIASMFRLGLGTAIRASPLETRSSSLAAGTVNRPSTTSWCWSSTTLHSLSNMIDDHDTVNKIRVRLQETDAEATVIEYMQKPRNCSNYTTYYY